MAKGCAWIVLIALCIACPPLGLVLLAFWAITTVFSR